MSDQQERWSNVGAAVRQALQEHAWSQTDLIQRSGVSSFTVRKVMNGQPGNYQSAKLGKIAKALWGDSARIDQILAGEEPPARVRSAGPVEPADEGDVDEVIQAIRRSKIITADQRDLLIVAYRGAVARTAHGRTGQVDGEENHLP